MGASYNLNARFLFIIALLFAICGGHAAVAIDAAAEFDRANKFYEQGKFPEAVSAYEALVKSGIQTASVCFNLGNAAYKAGEMGRAIAAYRMAERLTPRDSALRANLQFVRGKVYSDDRTRIPFWKTAIRLATLNELTALTFVSYWALCSVLACSEVTRRHYPKTALIFLIVSLASGGALAAAVHDQRAATEAIVTTREVTVRFGPLDESRTAFKLRDGAEIKVLATKDGWVEIYDSEKRSGWMRREDAIILPGALPAKTTQTAVP